RWLWSQRRIPCIASRSICSWFSTYGVPWVWKVGTVFMPQAWHLAGSASDQVTTGISGFMIRLAPALANSMRLQHGYQTYRKKVWLIAYLFVPYSMSTASSITIADSL